MKRPKTKLALAAPEFLRGEAAGGLLLILAAALAIVLANSGAAPWYRALLDAPSGIEIAHHRMTVHAWINDGLMAAFFLLLGLEIKRELLEGQLATWEQRRLPILAAAAGMGVPSLVYLLVSGGDPVQLRGWAIPAATDIAFALGVLALFASRAPAPLKMLLTSIAVADDVGAVLIIAFFYTEHVQLLAVAAAAAIFLLMAVLARRGVQSLWPYCALALCLWYAIFASGVHSTVAGVIAAAAIPAGDPLHRLERALAPIVSFLILPAFGFANAGVGLGSGLKDLSAVALGIAAALFLGKQIGVFGSIWISDRIGFARRPEGTSWLQIYGAALLCGIGFTMSLFIGELAFADRLVLADEAKIGTLAGSLLSAIAAILVLRRAAPRPLAPEAVSGPAI